MNAQIEKEFKFQAGLYFSDQFFLNLYTLSVHMEVSTESIREQNIAMERIHYFLYDKLEHAFFIKDTEKKLIDKLTNLGMKACPIPEEPYDQIIALVLISKLNAITEGRLIITDIVIESRLSDGVKFKENAETAQHVLGQNGWWRGFQPTIVDLPKYKLSDAKVVQLINNEWNEVCLSWKEKAPSNTEIVFDPEK
mgnify:FL=1